MIMTVSGSNRFRIPLAIIKNDPSDCCENSNLSNSGSMLTLLK